MFLSGPSGESTVVFSTGALPWHGAATTVVIALPAGIWTCSLIPYAIGSPPLGTFETSYTCLPGPSMNAADGMFAEPGEGAALEEQRGITTVCGSPPTGTPIATTPGAEMIDDAFASFTTVRGEHGGTTTTR